jgi:hypothetical protein
LIKHLPVKEDLNVTKTLQERGLREPRLTRKDKIEINRHSKVLKRRLVFDFAKKAWEF